jgi:hypothetical protein
MTEPHDCANGANCQRLQPAAKDRAKEYILTWIERSHKGADVYQVLEAMKAENAELRKALAAKL